MTVGMNSRDVIPEARALHPVLGQCLLVAAPLGVAHTTNSMSLLIE
jgi:hypothetical protein